MEEKPEDMYKSQKAFGRSINSKKGEKWALNVFEFRQCAASEDVVGL